MSARDKLTEAAAEASRYIVSDVLRGEATIDALLSPAMRSFLLEELGLTGENPYTVTDRYPMARDIDREDAWAEGFAAGRASVEGEATGAATGIGLSGNLRVKSDGLVADAFRAVPRKGNPYLDPDLPGVVSGPALCWAEGAASVEARLLSDEAVEAAARAAFFRDDLGGHIKGRWTWDTIPDDGREAYRAMVRDVLSAALRAGGTDDA